MLQKNTDLETGVHDLDLLRVIFTKIPRQIWICLISGMVSGILTHMFMLMNKLPNWDDLNNFKGYGTGDSWGRWMLKYIRPLFGDWSIPAINGMMAILIIAISSCLIVAALDLKSASSAVLIPVMAITFPGFTSTMAFMFTVTTYAMGILFCCLGAFLIRKYKYGFIPGIIMFVLSMGIYQSYICLAAGILVLGLLLDSIDGKNVSDLLKKGTLHAATLGVGMVLYVIATKIVVPVLGDSHGINTMGQIEVTRLPRLIMRCYKRITEYFLIEPYSFVSSGMHFINVVLLLLGLALFGYLFISRKLYKEKVLGALTILFAILEPLALASIYVLAPDTQDAALTMLYQYFFIYVVIIALAEKASARISFQTERTNLFRGIDKRIGILLSYLSVVFIVLIGYQNYLINNEAYFRMYLSFERAGSYYNRIISSVEEQEEYQYGDKLVITGNVYPEKYKVGFYEMDDERFTDFSGIATENGILTEGVRVGFIRTYLGIEIPDVNWDDIRAIKKTDEYEQMPYYPKEGSIQKINDTWIVKLCEDNSNS